MKILIDNGHGQNTPGKRSPDGRFLEFRFNRTIAKQVVEDLRDRGYDAELLVPEVRIPEDLAILESREGRRAIIDLHTEGIIEYLKIS
ncbi:MAG: N-acetylmuramoyl-L-alanine amidase [Candidatus Coprenecus sp.]